MAKQFCGLAHIGMIVRDTETTKKFYTENLGFTCVLEKLGGDGVTKIMFLQCGDLLLECIQKPVYEENHGSGIFVHVALDVKQIEQIGKDLNELGVEWVEGLVYQPSMWENGTKSMLFRGPDGEILEINERL